MIALFLALIWLSYLTNYKKSQKPKVIFFGKLGPRIKNARLKKVIIGSFICPHLLPLSIISLEWDHQYWIL